MRRHLTVAFALAFALQIGFAVAAAHAQTSTLPCDAFAKNADGSWTVLTTTYVEGPDVKLQKDATFPPGFIIRGYDIAALLAKACPNAAAAQPPAAAQPAAGSSQTQQQAPTQPPRTLLERYGDANGNIDIRQFSCGHLDDAPPDEAELLLAWYSGWYAGEQKRRGVSLPQVRYAINNVINYCKANRDKRLTDAIESFLK
jgi:HdeA/HdeB family